MASTGAEVTFVRTILTVYTLPILWPCHVTTGRSAARLVAEPRSQTAAVPTALAVQRHVALQNERSAFHAAKRISLMEGNARASSPPWPFIAPDPLADRE